MGKMRGINNRLIKAALLLVALLLVFSCAAPPKKAVIEEPAKPPEEKLPVEVQNEKAMAAYEDMLEMTIEHGKRNVLPQLEESYKNLIASYPDAYLAQESYWRLILMNLEDYNPPRVEQAEQHYKEFLKKYPGSRMKIIIDDAMARFFYKRRLWGSLIGICSSHVREYIETGELEIPIFMFFYAEAKMGLDDLKEAKKGYKIIIRHSPGSTESKLSKKRLDEIKNR